MLGCNLAFRLLAEQASATSTATFARTFSPPGKKKETLQHMTTNILAAVPSFNPIPQTGILNTIFHQTDVRIQVFDWPTTGYYINLIQLIILIALAVVITFVVERLTSKKPGGLVTGVILTVIGAYLAETFAKIPFDFSLEGVMIVASLVGAIIVGVFYTLIRGQFSKK